MIRKNVQWVINQLFSTLFESSIPTRKKLWRMNTKTQTQTHTYTYIHRWCLIILPLIVATEKVGFWPMSTRCWYFSVRDSFWYINEWSKNENYLAFVTVNFCMCNCWNMVGITVLSQHTFFLGYHKRDTLPWPARKHCFPHRWKKWTSV